MEHNKKLLNTTKIVRTQPKLLEHNQLDLELAQFCLTDACQLNASFCVAGWFL
jgi:hypothetical protein